MPGIIPNTVLTILYIAMLSMCIIALRTNNELRDKIVSPATYSAVNNSGLFVSLVFVVGATLCVISKMPLLIFHNQAE